jgi:hypothetical protein
MDVVGIIDGKKLAKLNKVYTKITTFLVNSLDPFAMNRIPK